MYLIKILLFAGLLSSALFAIEEDNDGPLSAAARSDSVSKRQRFDRPDEHEHAPHAASLANSREIHSPRLGQLVQGIGTKDLFLTICEFLGVYPTLNILTKLTKITDTNIKNNIVLWQVFAKAEKISNKFQANEANYSNVLSLIAVKKINDLSPEQFTEKMPGFLVLCGKHEDNMRRLFCYIGFDKGLSLAASYFKTTNSTCFFAQLTNALVNYMGSHEYWWRYDLIKGHKEALDGLAIYIEQLDLSTCQDPQLASHNLLKLIRHFVTITHASNRVFQAQSDWDNKLAAKAEAAITILHNGPRVISNDEAQISYMTMDIIYSTLYIAAKKPKRERYQSKIHISNSYDRHLGQFQEWPESYPPCRTILFEAGSWGYVLFYMLDVKVQKGIVGEATPNLETVKCWSEKKRWWNETYTKRFGSPEPTLSSHSTAQYRQHVSRGSSSSLNSAQVTTSSSSFSSSASGGAATISNSSSSSSSDQVQAPTSTSSYGGSSSRRAPTISSSSSLNSAQVTTSSSSFSSSASSSAATISSSSSGSFVSPAQAGALSKSLHGYGDSLRQECKFVHPRAPLVSKYFYGQLQNAEFLMNDFPDKIDLVVTRKYTCSQTGEIATRKDTLIRIVPPSGMNSIQAAKRAEALLMKYSTWHPLMPIINATNLFGLRDFPQIYPLLEYNLIETSIEIKTFYAPAVPSS